jgi:hypothetical protein
MGRAEALLYFFVPSGRTSASARQPEPIDKIVEANQPVGIDEHAEREHDARGHCRPDKFTPELWDCWRAGIGAGRDRAALLLAAHAPRQHDEQHGPPDDEIDRDRGGDRHGMVTCE